jgi:urocanate hydratase
MRTRFTLQSGCKLRCRGWRQEGLLHLLENVDPDNLFVYAALGKAARDWPSHDKIALRTMAEDETLIVQSVKPVGIIKTHDKAPIVAPADRP